MSDFKKIGIYGGTFDPIHHGHLILSEWAIVKLHLDLVYFVPASVHAFKKESELSPSEIRYNMIAAAIKNFPRLRVSRIEIDRPSTSYTIDTLKNINANESINRTELIYLIGSDNLREFHLWKNPDKILELAQVCVLKRPGYNENTINNKYKDKVNILDSPLISISATEIRKRVRENKPYKSLIPEEVYEIIEQNKLYRN